MDRIHARWLAVAAIVSSAVGLVMCPAGTLVLAAVLCLLNLDMTPRALDCRLQISVICTVLLALGLMACLPSATIWWAVCSCPTLVWLFGHPRANDIERHDAAKPERPWERPDRKKPGRPGRRGRKPGRTVLPPWQQVVDLQATRTEDNRTIWR